MGQEMSELVDGYSVTEADGGYKTVSSEFKQHCRNNNYKYCGLNPIVPFSFERFDDEQSTDCELDQKDNKEIVQELKTSYYDENIDSIIGKY